MLLNYLDYLQEKNSKKNCTFAQHIFICYLQDNNTDTIFGDIRIMIDNTYITLPSESYVSISSFVENDEVVYSTSLKLRGVFTNTITLGRPFIMLVDLKFDYSNISMGIQ